MIGTSDLANLTREQTSAPAFVPAAAAAVVLMTLLRRTPTASRVTRALWAYGRLILAVAALGDLGLLSVNLATAHSVNADGAVLLQAALDVFFLIFLLVSRRVRDAFNDFPLAAV